jgi:hypothetical protein
LFAIHPAVASLTLVSGSGGTTPLNVAVETAIKQIQRRCLVPEDEASRLLNETCLGNIDIDGFNN